ncbi:hypothetical protein EJB05_15378, partial [Eragrostis curvula]
YQMESEPTIDLEFILNQKDAKPIKLPISILKTITKNFSDDLRIGSGGFAEVYMGKFIMADERTRLLCFEYLSKGSLEKYISDASSGLNWTVRYRIINGICQGLQYLHDEMNMVHLDLKPANILLNDNMVPKISDFGLSRCFDEKQTRAITSTLVGSIAYVAPEFHDGVITKKSDIYSLGVIIAQILTGQKGHSRVEDVLECWRNRFGTAFPEMHNELKQIRLCSNIRMICGNSDPEKRPDIQQIINMLSEAHNEPLEEQVEFEETLEDVYTSVAKSSWWWDTNISHKRSKWLRLNLEDLDERVKMMIKMLGEDADSFAKRAEMYYRRRPELLRMVEEMYRSHRALAERYDDATRELSRSIQISTLPKGSGISEHDSPS